MSGHRVACTSLSYEIIKEIIIRVKGWVCPALCDTYATPVNSSYWFYTSNMRNDMMEPLGKRISNVSKAEPRSLLPSSIDVTRGSALDFSGKEPTIEVLIEALSELIIDAYVFSKRTDNQ